MPQGGSAIEDSDSSKTSDGAAGTGVVSKDGKWFWDGSRWSARRASVTGSVLPRILAWTLLGALPVGALISLPIGSVLSKINSAVAAFGVAVVLVAAEAVVVFLILRRTPRISVNRGTVTIGRPFNEGGRSISVESVSSIELMRGSMGALAFTEGEIGEGRVIMHITHGSPIELGWDAFAGRANTLAWLLGVPLIDAAEASRRRVAAAQARDPGRDKRQRVLVIVGTALFLLLVLVLLFGPLVTSIFQMITHR